MNFERPQTAHPPKVQRTNRTSEKDFEVLTVAATPTAVESLFSGLKPYNCSACSTTPVHKRARPEEHSSYSSYTTFLKKDSFRCLRTLRQRWYTFRNLEWLETAISPSPTAWRASSRPGSPPTYSWSVCAIGYPFATGLFFLLGGFRFVASVSTSLEGGAESRHVARG